jgi:hypothetical protein
MFFVFISPLVFFFVFFKNCLVFFFFTIILLVKRIWILEEYKQISDIFVTF